MREQPAPLVGIPLPPKKGDVGIFEPLDAGRPPALDVLEVIDSDNMVVRAWYSPGGDATFVDLWIRGIATKGLAAGAVVRLRQVFHVTGSQLFDTTCGKRSLPLLEPLDLSPYR